MASNSKNPLIVAGAVVAGVLVYQWLYVQCPWIMLLVTGAVAAVCTIPPFSQVIQRMYYQYHPVARIGYVMGFTRAVTDTYAVAAGLRLGLFDHLQKFGARSAAQLAEEMASQNKEQSYSAKGFSVLCDTLVAAYVLNAETTSDGTIVFSNSPIASHHLVRAEPGKINPMFVGGFVNLLTRGPFVSKLERLPDIVKQGGMTDEKAFVDTADSQFWQFFAEDTLSFSSGPAEKMAKHASKYVSSHPGTIRVLDVAAGSGAYGANFAKLYPTADVTMLDWPTVLERAQRNINAYFPQEAPRIHMLPGSVFDIPQDQMGGPYDVILVSQFYHHFDHKTNVELTRKLAAALKPSGLFIINDFVTNNGCQSPWEDTTGRRFRLTMLSTTREGDAYPKSEYESLIKEGGLVLDTIAGAFPMPNSYVVAHKA